MCINLFSGGFVFEKIRNIRISKKERNSWLIVEVRKCHRRLFI